MSILTKEEKKKHIQEITCSKSKVRQSHKNITGLKVAHLFPVCFFYVFALYIKTLGRTPGYCTQRKQQPFRCEIRETETNALANTTWALCLPYCFNRTEANDLNTTILSIRGEISVFFSWLKWGDP